MSLSDIIGLVGFLSGLIVCVVLSVRECRKEEAERRPWSDRFPALSTHESWTLHRWGYKVDDIKDYVELARVLRECELRRQLHGLTADDARLLVTSLTVDELAGLDSGVAAQVQLQKLRTPV